MKLTHTLTSTLLLFTATFSQAQDLSNRLVGTPISSPCVNYGSGPQLAEYAFDGNPDTYYASDARSYTWVGLDLGEPHVITHLGYMARNYSDGPNRVKLGVFEGANDPNFLDAVPLYVIPEAGKIKEMITVDVNVSRGFRYVRYVGPDNVRCNIAEVGFWGTKGEGDDSRFYQVTCLPTVSIHTYSGNAPMDKVNDLEANITITYNGGTLIQEYPITTKCRGNASFGFPKKPYRVKFADGKKHHMLNDSPLKSPAKAKKWTLINNYGDKTLMRNILAFEVSKRLDMPYTPYCQPVDVIMNGEYKGCYQLCDQITINKNRVDITEMEPTDVIEPNVSGGYLIEIDAYANQEKSKFNSNRNTPVTIKSPDEDDIVNAQTTYIRDYFNKLEADLYKTNYTDPSEGYRRRLDVTSFLKHFLVGEFSGNTDTYWSVYMYKDREEDLFHVSPPWDFDLAFNNDNRTYPVCRRSDWVFRTGGSCANGMSNFVSRILADPAADKELKTLWRNARNSGAIGVDTLIAFVDSMANVMKNSADLNFTRWPILNSQVHMNAFALGSFEAEVNVLRQYIIDRVEWIDNYLGYRSGEVMGDTVMYISKPEQLVAFANISNKGGYGSTAYLTADLDMKGQKMTSIGSGTRPFVGTFDGQGHTISNLEITGGDGTGLFGIVSGGVEIRDFILDNTCSITGGNYVGVVGMSNGTGTITINKVGNEGTIAGSRNVAGIIGCNMGSEAYFNITNCYNTGNIQGEAESGAISGWVGSNYNVKNCWNVGEVWGIEQGRDMFRYGGFARDVRIYSTNGTQAQIVSTDDVRNGRLCWLVNWEKSDNPTWFQKIGTDPHPTFEFSRGVVYQLEDGTYTNGQFMLGDANADGVINADDLAMIADYIMGRPTEGIDLMNADPNADGVIDAIDLVLTGNLTRTYRVLPAVKADKPAQITAADGSIQRGVTKRFSTILKSDEPQTVFQADIVLPDGITLDPTTTARGTTLSSSHQLDIAPTENGFRILAYSPTLQNFTSNYATAFVLKLVATEGFSEGNIVIGNQLIATAENVQSRPADTSYKLTLAPTLVSSIVPAQNTYELKLGETVTATIEVTVLPETATNKTVSYTSSAPEVASVDANGVLTAQNEGEATITISATDASKVKATVKVTVLADDSAIEGVEADPVNDTAYDVRGLRIDKAQKGKVYIVGGKKVMIK